MNLNELLNSIKDAESNGAKVVGTLVQWTVSEDARIAQDKLKSIVDAAPGNFSTRRPMSFKRRFTRAINEVNRTKGTRGFELRKVGRVNNDQIVYSRVKYDIDKQDLDNSVTGYTDGWIAANTTKEDIRGHDSLRKIIAPLIDDDLWAGEIRSFFTAAVREAASFSTRNSGGAYFVPNSGDTICNLLGVFSDVSQNMIAGTVRVLALPILGSEAVDAELASEFEDRVMTEIDQFEARLNQFFETETKKQDRSLASKLAEIEEFRDQATLYEALLGAKFKSITKSLDRLENVTEKYIADNARADSADDLDEDEAVRQLLEDEDREAEDLLAEIKEKADLTIIDGEEEIDVDELIA